MAVLDLLFAAFSEQGQALVQPAPEKNAQLKELEELERLPLHGLVETMNEEYLQLDQMITSIEEEMSLVTRRISLQQFL